MIQPYPEAVVGPSTCLTSGPLGFPLRQLLVLLFYVFAVSVDLIATTPGVTSSCSSFGLTVIRTTHHNAGSSETHN